MKNENKSKKSPSQLFWWPICLVVIVLSAVLISTDTSAQEQVTKFRNPDAKLENCFEIGFDFDKGIYMNWTGKAEVRYKQFENKLKRYVRHNKDDEEAAEMLKFLQEEVGPIMPDYFNGDYDARVKINNIAEKDKKKKEWLEGSIGGKAMTKKKGAVSRVRGYQFLKVYDEKAVSKGYAKANIQIPHDVEALGLKLFTLDVNAAGGSASDTITIYNRPDGKPQAEVKAGAKMWALDGTDGWMRVTYVDDKGDLVWGYVLGPKIQKKVEELSGQPVPKREKGKKKF